jgi:hypothetical protein
MLLDELIDEVGLFNDGVITVMRLWRVSGPFEIHHEELVILERIRRLNQFSP